MAFTRKTWVNITYENNYLLYFLVLIIVSSSRINVFQLIKIIFIYCRKDLSSILNFWNRRNFKTIYNIEKIFAQNFLFFFIEIYVGKKRIIPTLTFFINTYIFSKLSMKNHKFFIFHFLSTFLEILLKFSANQVKNFHWQFFLNSS